MILKYMIYDDIRRKFILEYL